MKETNPRHTPGRHAEVHALHNVSATQRLARQTRCRTGGVSDGGVGGVGGVGGGGGVGGVGGVGGGGDGTGGGGRAGGVVGGGLVGDRCTTRLGQSGQSVPSGQSAETLPCPPSSHLRLCVRSVDSVPARRMRQVDNRTTAVPGWTGGRHGGGGGKGGCGGQGGHGGRAGTGGGCDGGDGALSDVSLLTNTAMAKTASGNVVSAAKRNMHTFAREQNGDAWVRALVDVAALLSLSTEIGATGALALAGPLTGATVLTDKRGLVSREDDTARSSISSK